MTLPVSVCDTLFTENAQLPLTVTLVHVMEPMTDEQRETAQWLGYTLGHYEEPCLYIEYNIHGRNKGSVKVHMEADEQGRLVTIIDPDDWAGRRYAVARRTQHGHTYVQQELFA